MRSNPFEEIDRLIDRLSRQFDEATQSWERGESLDLLPTMAKSMAVDLVEHDDEFVVTVDLPGFDREDVDVRVTDHTLSIKAEQATETEEGEETYLHRERRHRSLHRSIRLPGDVDAEAVKARMKNGVLTITLPKSEAEHVRTIDIE